MGQTARIDVRLQVAKEKETVNVDARAPLVDSGSNAIGNVVTGRELVELPLNGRNFTQLGLLQPGVAPMTAGLAEAGGSLRAGQAYAVNGQRPESNNYLLDGVTNVNRVDGGYALKTPVDAIQEFRILTETAPAEYGGTSGATTTVVTRSGQQSTARHGVRVPAQRQPGRAQLFRIERGAAEAESVRRDVGRTAAAEQGFPFRLLRRLPEPAGHHAERHGAERCGADAATSPGLRDPQTGQPVPLINYLSGQPFPNNQIPAPFLNATALNLVQFYPHANAGPNLFVTTQTMQNRTDQGGMHFDHVFNERDRLFVHYAHSASSNVNPLSVAGANVPGFPVGEDLSTHTVAVSETHVFSGSTVNDLRLGFFRNGFDTDKPLNRTRPRDLGFNYGSTLSAAEGPPFFIVSGYASIGDPITGPRDTTQNTFQAHDAVSHVTGAHSFRLGWISGATRSI